VLRLTGFIDIDLDENTATIARMRWTVITSTGLGHDLAHAETPFAQFTYAYTQSLPFFM